jgi:hypothetical protein
MNLTGSMDGTGDVTWKAADGSEYVFTYGSGTPKTIKLVRTVMDYIYATGTGKLTQLLSCTPESFSETSATTYTLTSASACSKQEFDSTVGGLSKTYTPSQFKDANLYNTQYTYSQTYGVVTEVEAADSLKNSAGKKTKYTYSATKTRVTKVEQPQDSANQWQETTYDDHLFATGLKRKDIGSWSVDPIVSVSVYDNNGNLYQSWQANPDYTSTPRWDGNTAHGYDKVRELTYDRLGRMAGTARTWAPTTRRTPGSAARGSARTATAWARRA